MNKTTIFVCLGAAAGISLAVAGNLPERNRTAPSAPVTTSSEAVIEDVFAISDEKSNIPLIGTTWEILMIGDKKISLDQSDAKRPFLLLNKKESQASGFSGCNRFTGTYKSDATSLKFSSAMAMTRMACPEMGTETTFMDVLTRAKSWKIEGTTLHLYAADGKPLASFTALSQ